MRGSVNADIYIFKKKTAKWWPEDERPIEIPDISSIHQETN